MSRGGCRHPDCAYRNRQDPGRSGQCLYMMLTGKSRIRGLPESLQDPKHCPRYVPSGRRAPRPPEPIREPREEAALPWAADARILYDQGLCDKEIAERLGLKADQVYHWRHRKAKLPRNPAPHGPKSRYDWDKAMEMHRKGCGDTEIAKTIGCSMTSIYRWRAKHNLRPNKEGRK